MPNLCYKYTPLNVVNSRERAYFLGKITNDTRPRVILLTDVFLSESKVNNVNFHCMKESKRQCRGYVTRMGYMAFGFNPLGTEARLNQQLSSARSGRDAPRAHRGKLLTWDVYRLIVSSKICIQIYNKKAEN